LKANEDFPSSRFNSNRIVFNRLQRAGSPLKFRGTKRTFNRFTRRIDSRAHADFYFTDAERSPGYAHHSANGDSGPDPTFVQSTSR
jgi:hypothetical protein